MTGPAGGTGRPYTRFVIVGDARTGSNLLWSALNSHPRVICFREVFHFAHEFIDYAVPGFDDRATADVTLRREDAVRFLYERIFREFQPAIHAVGFKFLYGHRWGFEPVVRALGEDRDIRVIHLRRRNIVRMFVSVRIAESTGRWLEPVPVGGWRRALAVMRRPLLGAGRGVEPAPRPRLHVSAREIIAFEEQHRREAMKMDALIRGHQVMTLLYEDMAHDRDMAFDSVQRFLGVRPRRLKVGLRRQNPEPLRELIANYDELAAELAGTPYAPLLDEGNYP